MAWYRFWASRLSCSCCKEQVNAAPKFATSCTLSSDEGDAWTPLTYVSGGAAAAALPSLGKSLMACMLPWRD
eukprot:9489365-Pyramimonas_sp.AAC.3